MRLARLPQVAIGLFRAGVRAIPRRRDWLSNQVRREMRHRIGSQLAGRIRSSLREHSLPWLLGVFAASIFVSWWQDSSQDLSALQATYETLWQVQTGFAGVALPVLLFVIEISKERSRVAPTNEVLLRRTYVLPVFVFALLGALRIGVDLAWWPSRAAFLTDLAILAVTVLLTARAFSIVVRLLVHPSLLQSHALKLVKEKTVASLRGSIEIRLGNNLMFARLNQMNVGYMPWRGSNQFLVLRSANIGLFLDLNFRRLESFVKELPSRPGGGGVISTEGPQPSTAPGPIPVGTSVSLMKRYREPVQTDNEGLIQIDTRAFGSLDQDSLERRIQKIFRIGTFE